MSIRIHYRSGKNIIFANLEPDSIIKYAHEHNINYMNSSTSKIFTMLWKQIIDMGNINIRENKEHVYIENPTNNTTSDSNKPLICPIYISLKNGEKYNVWLMLPINGKMVLLGEDSKKNIITQIPYENPVTIIFDKKLETDLESSSMPTIYLPPRKILRENFTENFISCKKYKSIKYILFFIIIILLLYFAYILFFKTKYKSNKLIY